MVSEPIDATQPPDGARRGIRSFVVRSGRITEAQRRALLELWPRFGIDWPPAVASDPMQWFAHPAPLSVEIGFGSGETLARLALAQPARNFIGIEVHRPGIGQLLRRADRLGLTNLRVVCGDAVEVLRRAFRSSSIDEILILFPDPWHKKRHHKRRLIQADFAALLADRLAAGGRLWIATDWQPYADHMLAVLNATPGLRNLAGGGFAPRPSWREPTRFEQRGARLGHRVWDLAYEKAARIPSSTN